MPDPHIFLPDDGDRLQRMLFYPRASRVDGGGVARMPGGEERDAVAAGDSLQLARLADSDARGFLKQDMQAFLQRQARRFEACLRRCTQRDGLQLGHCLKQFDKTLTAGNAR